MNKDEILSSFHVETKASYPQEKIEDYFKSSNFQL
jgi:hypothetical protein